MAVDSKYANLPGIDTQPDVYETSDLPEVDQQGEPEELNSESVERLKVSTETAFNKFKDSTLLTGSIDFSDKITQSRRTGYGVARTEYEILEDGNQKETPVQKYQRLQHEMRQLAEEVTELEKTAKAEKDTSKISPGVLSDQVSALQEQLYGLHLEKVLGTEAIVELSDPKGSLPKKLFSQLDVYKKHSLESPAEESAKTSAAFKDGHITYELYSRPSRERFSQTSKIAELEQKISQLEAMLGQDPEKLSYLTADGTSKTLMESVESLHSKLSTLDIAYIDHVDLRIHSLLQKMDQAKEKKTALDSTKEAKINELYDIVHKWDSVADSLPLIVERMKTLKELHEQALQFSQALTQLDTAQQQVTSGLQNQSVILKELKESFSANMSAIDANCKSLQERFDKIGK